MAILEHTREKIRARLLIQSRVGRAPDSELCVDHSHASSAHALIEWRAPGMWEIRDLASRNGTFVNGARLPSGGWHPLELGDRLAFGDAADEWRVLDLGRPGAEAWCRATNERRIAEDQILSLSDDPHDWIDVVEDRPGTWVIERDGHCELARDGQEIAVGDRRWQLMLPAGLSPTEGLDAADRPATAPPRMEFRVSADLEHVELRVEWAGQTMTTSRAYARGLLVLAQARLSDQQQGLGHADENGWIYADELCALAGYESESRLNVEVHRARRDLAQGLGIPNAAALIQRRLGTRQLRIGTPALAVVELGHAAC